ncbi:response regulator [Candidatus Nitrospira bockiana]
MPRILAIDDDENFLLALREALERSNREVVLETATTAKEGLSLITQRQFDVIVTDFRMPGRDGIELLKEARTLAPGTPVLLLTAYVSAALQQEAAKYGAYAVLEKPLDADVLYTVVTRSILRSELLRRTVPPVYESLPSYEEGLGLHERIDQVNQRLNDTLRRAS